MTIDTSKWKVSTKSLIGVLTTLSALWQIEQVRDFVISQVHAHPHWAGGAAFIGSLWTLLHNPQVEKTLGIDE